MMDGSNIDEPSRLSLLDLPKISATDPDWARETVKSFWDPGRKLLRAVRRYQASRGLQPDGYASLDMLNRLR